MHIIYSDENDRLTPEIWKLMDQAFERAMENEFGPELALEGVSLSDIEPELGVTIVDKNEYKRLMDFIRKTDPKAFVTVYSVSEMRYQPKIKPTK